MRSIFLFKILDCLKFEDKLVRLNERNLKKKKSIIPDFEDEKVIILDQANVNTEISDDSANKKQKA